MIWEWGTGNSVLQLHWMYPEPGREELQRDIAVCRKTVLFVVQEGAHPILSPDSTTPLYYGKCDSLSTLLPPRTLEVLQILFI